MRRSAPEPWPDADDALRARAAELGPWFHNLKLPGGVETAPGHPLGDFPAVKWWQLSPHLPARLDGWSALDVGCNAGFYTFELARRGARVVAVDHDPRYLEQARWAGDVLGMSGQVEFTQCDVYDLAGWRERFDLVLFMGVFYHLRHPLLGLDAVSALCRRLMVFQTLTMPGDEVVEDTAGRGIDSREDLAKPGWPKMAFLARSFEDDPTNWWAPNHAAVLAMLRSAGMRSVRRAAHEIYLCEPGQGVSR